MLDSGKFNAHDTSVNVWVCSYTLQNGHLIFFFFFFFWGGGGLQLPQFPPCLICLWTYMYMHVVYSCTCTCTFYFCWHVVTLCLFPSQRSTLFGFHRLLPNPSLELQSYMYIPNYNAFPHLAYLITCFSSTCVYLLHKPRQVCGFLITPFESWTMCALHTKGNRPMRIANKDSHSYCMCGERVDLLYNLLCCVFKGLCLKGLIKLLDFKRHNG